VSSYFVDSSAVIKRYIDEIGSAWVDSITAPDTGARLFVAAITGAEVVAAITRRHRGGHILATDASSAIARFKSAFAGDYLVVDVSRPLVEEAMILAERHGLRGYDAVQLAAAMQVQAGARIVNESIILVSSDAELNAAATREGLAVDDPNLHP
jgi:hypothetical protein